MSTPTPETTPLTTADPPADPGAFQSSLGLVIDSTTATRVLGHIDFGPQHHSHLGTVFGGAFASIIESAPATGARLAAGQNGADVVGVQNTTDFLRPFTQGRATVAWIRLREEAEAPTAESLNEFCAGRIAHYKVPRYVRVIDEFPMTVTGKVRKVDLRAQAVDLLAHGVE